MAEEQYKWLNRETTERLLRGEPLEAFDASVREQAERLADVLGALRGDPPIGAELPGEEGALAAFRKARDHAAAEPLTGPAAGTGMSGADRAPARRAAGARPAGGAGSRPARGAVGARRRGWACPIPLALAAALAVCTVGGVAVAAGTGVLPTPFGHDGPRPGVSVSVASTPDGGPDAPSTDATRGSAPATGTPGTSAEGGSGDGHGGRPSRDTAGKDGGRTGGRDRTERGDGTDGHSGSGRRGLVSACRDIRDGRRLREPRARLVEGAAGGSSRVRSYCRRLLGTVRGGHDRDGWGDDVKNDVLAPRDFLNDDHEDSASDQGDRGDDGDDHGDGDEGGGGDGDDSGEKGGGRAALLLARPPAASASPVAPSPDASPSPTDDAR